MNADTSEQLLPMNWWRAQKTAAAIGFAPDPANDPITPLLDADVCDVAEEERSFDVTDVERQRATKWFNEHISVHVLNLPEDTTRMELISSRLKKLGLVYHRVDGVKIPDIEAIRWAQS